VIEVERKPGQRRRFSRDPDLDLVEALRFHNQRKRPLRRRLYRTRRNSYEMPILYIARSNVDLCVALNRRRGCESTERLLEVQLAQALPRLRASRLGISKVGNVRDTAATTHIASSSSCLKSAEMFNQSCLVQSCFPPCLCLAAGFAVTA
jgi:hypothetical protein